MQERFNYYCESGNIDDAKNLFTIFPGLDVYEAMSKGCKHLEIAKWLDSLVYYPAQDAFDYCCRESSIAAKYFYIRGAEIDDYSFKLACSGTNLELVKWLYRKNNKVQVDLLCVNSPDVLEFLIAAFPDSDLHIENDSLFINHPEFRDLLVAATRCTESPLFNYGNRLYIMNPGYTPLEGWRVSWINGILTYFKIVE